VRHDLDAAHQSLGDAGLVSALFDDEGTYKLGLELLEMLINVLAFLVADANNHQLELVDLADRLGHRLLAVICALDDR